MIRDLLFVAAVVGACFLAGGAFAVGCNLAWWVVDCWRTRPLGRPLAPLSPSDDDGGTNPQE